jgi:hypothetical protein
MPQQAPLTLAGSVGCLKPRALKFLQSDLQIIRTSLIITSLFGDAARFRCGNPNLSFIFLSIALRSFN